MADVLDPARTGTETPADQTPPAAPAPVDPIAAAIDAALGGLDPALLADPARLLEIFKLKAAQAELAKQAQEEAALRRNLPTARAARILRTAWLEKGAKVDKADLDAIPDLVAALEAMAAAAPVGKRAQSGTTGPKGPRDPNAVPMGGAVQPDGIDPATGEPWRLKLLENARVKGPYLYGSHRHWWRIRDTRTNQDMVDPEPQPDAQPTEVGPNFANKTWAELTLNKLMTTIDPSDVPALEEAARARIVQSDPQKRAY